MPFTLSNNHLIALSSSLSLKSLLSRSSSLRFLFLAMAESTTENSAETDAVNFGFERLEMYQKDLANTVDPYDRHVFLCYKTHDVWPPRVEASDSDPLPKRLAEALKARKNDISVKTRLTICEGREETELADGDVLVFPEMVKYRGLKDADVDNFVEDVFVNGEPWDSGIQEGLKGSHVFVCAHNTRDRRCGVCGPALIDKFKVEIESKGLQGQVFVSACSHVGGHKYAGNLIVFSADSDGKVSGHWYGYVAPADVSELLDKHIGKGEIIERIWRGQMGAVIVDAEKVDEHHLPNGNDLKNDREKQLEPEESRTEEKAAVESCCQGANGISCCQDGNLGEKPSLKETVTSCCQGANGISCCSAGNSEEKQGKKSLERLTSWMGKWEQHEVLAAAGIVGAVATLAVACSLYKRSR